MTDSAASSSSHAGGLPGDPQSALFAGLVLQQTQMAMMFLGQIPHPEKGEPVKDLDGARLFIDTLEMIEAKTRGNLSADEGAMLKQSLMSVRMAYVEASREPASSAAPAASQPAAAAEEVKSPAAEDVAEEPPPTAPTDDEARKKFVKKY